MGTRGVHSHEGVSISYEYAYGDTGSPKFFDTGPIVQRYNLRTTRMDVNYIWNARGRGQPRVRVRTRSLTLELGTSRSRRDLALEVVAISLSKSVELAAFISTSRFILLQQQLVANYSLAHFFPAFVLS